MPPKQLVNDRRSVEIDLTVDAPLDIEHDVVDLGNEIESMLHAARNKKNVKLQRSLQQINAILLQCDDAVKRGMSAAGFVQMYNQQHPNEPLAVQSLSNWRKRRDELRAQQRGANATRVGYAHRTRGRPVMLSSLEVKQVMNFFDRHRAEHIAVSCTMVAKFMRVAMRHHRPLLYQRRDSSCARWTCASANERAIAQQSLLRLSTAGARSTPQSIASPCTLSTRGRFSTSTSSLCGSSHRRRSGRGQGGLPT